MKIRIEINGMHIASSYDGDTVGKGFYIPTEMHEHLSTLPIEPKVVIKTKGNIELFVKDSDFTTYLRSFKKV